MSGNNHSLNGQLAIAVHPDEERFWLASTFIPPQFAVYVVSCDPSGDLVLLDCGKASSKNEPLFFSLVCIDPQHLDDLRALKANPAIQHHFARSEAVCIRAAGSIEILQTILSELAKYTARVAHYSVGQVFALSSMRRDYENLHLRFSALESYIQRSGTRLVRERMFIAPATDRDDGPLLIAVPHGRSAQVLPVGSKGLCAIDVFVKFASADLSGGLVQVSLLLGDGKDPITAWSIKPENQIASEGGWHSLALDCAVEGINKSVVVQFELQGLTPSDVWFGVSKLNPNPAYCWSNLQTGKPVADRPLSLRIWEAPPGLRVPHVPNIILAPARKADPEGGRRLPGHALSKCRPIYAGWQPGFEAVEYFPNSDAIGVHPPETGVCVGALDKVIPATAISVSATAFLAHENAEPVEFALAIFETLNETESVTGVSWAEFPILQKPLAWSGWRGVERLCYHQLTVVLPSESYPRSSPLSMAMLTRMESGRHNSFAWARFTDVRVEENI